MLSIKLRLIRHALSVTHDVAGNAALHRLRKIGAIL